MSETVYDALFHHANVSADHAEIEAAGLRNELREAHEMIIRTKVIGWRHAVTSLNFYACQLHQRDGMSAADLLEDVRVIVGMGHAITGEIHRYRRRWGRGPVNDGDMALARRFARDLLASVRPIHRRVKAQRKDAA